MLNVKNMFRYSILCFQKRSTLLTFYLFRTFEATLFVGALSKGDLVRTTSELSGRTFFVAPFSVGSVGRSFSVGTATKSEIGFLLFWCWTIALFGSNWVCFEFIRICFNVIEIVLMFLKFVLMLLFFLLLIYF